MERKRADRVADLLLQELAEVLHRKVKDPRVAAVTLTAVKVSADLQRARVFYSLLGDEAVRSAAAAGLESARGFIKRELGKRLELRRMPEITFCFDESLEYGSRIEKLLGELKDKVDR